MKTDCPFGADAVQIHWFDDDACLNNVALVSRFVCHVFILSVISVYDNLLFLGVGAAASAVQHYLTAVSTAQFAILVLLQNDCLSDLNVSSVELNMVVNG